MYYCFVNPLIYTILPAMNLNVNANAFQLKFENRTNVREQQTYMGHGGTIFIA